MGAEDSPGGCTGNTHQLNSQTRIDDRCYQWRIAPRIKNGLFEGMQDGRLWVVLIIGYRDKVYSVRGSNGVISDGPPVVQDHDPWAVVVGRLPQKHPPQMLEWTNQMSGYVIHTTHSSMRQTPEG
jgi:hypothetical protein